MTTETQEATIPATTQNPSTPAATAPTQGGPVQAATPAAPVKAAPANVEGEGQQPAPEGVSNEYEGIFGASTTYESTGNENLDTVLKWAGQLGLDIDTCPEMQAAAKGNFGPIKALLASKQIPGADAYIALAEAGYREAVAAMQAKTEAVQRIVVEAAGGEEQWAEVFEWARQNADPEEKEMINAAFERGGFVAEAVARALVSNYYEATGASAPPRATPVRATAATQPAGNQYGPLSPKEYAEEVHKLRLSMRGKPIEGTPEYRALQARRMAYR
ncbi:hypothetical protein [Pusillimonas sp.]|uniref:hypothetical protein n=1 Tax=Pusillimonas sp. TaxID=3040095 RepID=UPI0037C9C510